MLGIRRVMPKTPHSSRGPSRSVWTVAAFERRAAVAGVAAVRSHPKSSARACAAQDASGLGGRPGSSRPWGGLRLRATVAAMLDVAPPLSVPIVWADLVCPDRDAVLELTTTVLG